MELSIKADLKLLPELMAKFPVAAKTATVNRITEALLLLERNVKKETPRGAGPVHISDTIFHKVEMGKPIWGMIGTPAKYGEPLELGSKPHFPPVAPILYWVERKLGLTGSEAKSVAFLIARSISRKGTEAAKMFTTAFKENSAKVLQILGQIPNDIVKMVS